MSKRIVFPAFHSNQFAYTWNESDYELSWRFNRHGSPLHTNAGTFATYGHGICQHSPESQLQVGETLEYLAALASHLINNPADVAIVAKQWPSNIMTSRDDVVFALSLKYNEEKPRYYSIDTRKTSTSESKRHDKRFEVLPEWANGTAESALRLLASEYATRLERFALAEFINEIAWQVGACTMSHRTQTGAAGIVPRDDSDYNTTRANNIHNAFIVVDQLVRAYRLQDHAARSMSCLQNNYLRNELGIGREDTAAVDTDTDSIRTDTDTDSSDIDTAAAAVA